MDSSPSPQLKLSRRPSNSLIRSNLTTVRSSSRRQNLADQKDRRGKTGNLAAGVLAGEAPRPSLERLPRAEPMAKQGGDAPPAEGETTKPKKKQEKDCGQFLYVFSSGTSDIHLPSFNQRKPKGYRGSGRWRS